MKDKGDYKIQVLFSLMDKNYPQGEELYFDSGEEAIIRAILILKMAIKGGDLIQANKYGNSTIVQFIDDPSLQVRIVPNILAPGHEQIGPYSFMSGMMLSDFPEN